MSLEVAHQVLSQFQVGEVVSVEPFRDRGNINLDAYLVADVNGKAFVLQRINTAVFAMPHLVMEGMRASLEAQAAGASKTPIRWEVPELTPSREGEWYVEEDGCWRLMRYIEGAVTYKSLSQISEHKRLDAAQAVGAGLALYHDLTASIDPNLIQTALPGYRDTKLYFDQLDSVLEGCRTLDSTFHRLPEDPEVRQATARHFLCTLDDEPGRLRRLDPELARFIELALENREFGLSLQLAVSDGEIRKTAIHGDTKIENFLFDPVTGETIALVDLDTVMPYTWLADWGDMARSLVNVAGECETDLSKVTVDWDIYAALLEGFMSTSTSASPKEIAWMHRAVRVIALELGIRFLADYLRGDTYFRLLPDDPRDLNKTRAMVQLTLFERLAVVPSHLEAKDLSRMQVPSGA